MSNDAPSRRSSPGHRQGLLRDKTSVFFAVVFPLMFLVLFGGIFADQTQSKVDLIAGRRRLAGRRPARRTPRRPSTRPSTSSSPTTSTPRSSKVRKGDADVAIEMQGDTLVAHYTQTDQVKAAITQGALQAFVDGTNVALLSAAPARRRRTPSRPSRSRTTRSRPSSSYTPGLLGWAVAMSAAFGAAATLQGWRQSKLIRRLQLAPVSTRTVVGARVAVTVGDRAGAAGDLRRASGRRRSGSR